MEGTGGFLHPEQVIKQINFTPGQKVADFGCGAGYFTILMAQAVGPDGQVYACDVQTGPLESVSNKAKTTNIFNIKIIRCNLEIPNGSKITSESLDWVMVANILFQSQKKEAILQEAKRVLKSQGQIIIIDWDPKASLAPKKGWSLSRDQAIDITKKLDLTLVKEIQAGEYHWGMILKKS